jgi:plasmid stability protein
MSSHTSQASQADQRRDKFDAVLRVRLPESMMVALRQRAAENLEDVADVVRRLLLAALKQPSAPAQSGMKEGE